MTIKNPSSTSNNDKANKYCSARKSISWNELKAIDSNYQYIVSKIFGEDLLKTKLIKSCTDLLHYSIEINNSSPILSPESHSLTCRVRNFIDRKGFYLSPHNDSSETLIAILIPLEENITTTTLFTRPPLNAATRREVKPSNMFACSFKNNRYLIEGPEKDYVQLYRKGSQSNYHYESSWIGLSPKLFLGDALVLPNPLCTSWNANPSLKGLLGKFTSHGVFPPIQDTLRPMLLVDYLITDEKYIHKDNEYDLLINCGRLNNLI